LPAFEGVGLNDPNEKADGKSDAVVIVTIVVPVISMVAVRDGWGDPPVPVATDGSANPR